jgi:hypothetical protein
MSDSAMAYVARKPCGCVVAATVDEPRHAKDVAKSIAKWVRAGDAVERMTVGEARALPWGHPCEHDAQEAQAESAQLALETS